MSSAVIFPRPGTSAPPIQTQGSGKPLPFSIPQNRKKALLSPARYAIVRIADGKAIGVIDLIGRGETDAKVA